MEWHIDDTVFLIGLLVECPLGGNPEYCPFHALRTLPLARRLEFISGLTGAEKAGYMRRHRQCLHARESLPAVSMEAA